MTQIERIQTEIKALPPKEFAQIRTWFAELDWQAWDKQLEEDVATGKLDFLREEAMAAKAENRLRAL